MYVKEVQGGSDLNQLLKILLIGQKGGTDPLYPLYPADLHPGSTDILKNPIIIIVHECFSDR